MTGRSAVGLLLSLALAHCALAAVPAPQGLAQAGAPIGFVGFVTDPLDAMQRAGVRVIVQQAVDDQGNTIIAVRVYEAGRDAFGDGFWSERVSLCGVPTPSYSVQLAAPTANEDKPPAFLVFDRYEMFPDKPAAADADEEQH